MSQRPCTGISQRTSRTTVLAKVLPFRQDACTFDGLVDGDHVGRPRALWRDVRCLPRVRGYPVRSAGTPRAGGHVPAGPARPDRAQEWLAGGRGGGGCHAGPRAAAALSGQPGCRCRLGPPASLRARDLRRPRRDWHPGRGRFPEEGAASVGVQRQDSGTVGKVENCQIGVFRTSARSRGHVFLDQRLYLAEVWCDDPARRAMAKVPEGGRLPDQAGASDRHAGARLDAAGADALGDWGRSLWGRPDWATMRSATGRAGPPHHLVDAAARLAGRDPQSGRGAKGDVPLAWPV